MMKSWPLTVLTLFTFLFPLFPSLAGIYKKGFGTKAFFGHHLGSTLEIDLSKSYISAYMDFSQRTPVRRSLQEDLDFQEEMEFYLGQLKNILTPQYFLLEFDYYPLTNLGIALKRSDSSLYRESEIKYRKRHINPFQILATRYEEPYSLSIFLGEIIPFFAGTEQKGIKPTQSGSAVMGHVLTAGNRSIIDLVNQKDNWFQYAFKIKGTNETKGNKKKWMFQFGYIQHQGPHFFDAVIFQIMRDWATENDPSFFKNLKIEYLFNIPVENVRERRSFEKYTTFQKIIFGRNHYFKNFVLGLDLGVKWELFKRGNAETFSETSFILSPNLSW